MEQVTELYTRAYLGDQGLKFWKTDLGQYIKARIDQKESEILSHLASCGEHELKELQAQLFATRSIETWIDELINDGQQAINELEENQ